MYWSGFYYPGGSKLMRLSEDDSRCICTLYSLRDGKETETFPIGLCEGTTFEDLRSMIRGTCGESPGMEIANEVSNPDRFEQIDETLAAGNPLSMSRIFDLISRIRSEGMIVHGGAVGGQNLSDGGYEGFYLLGDGTVLFCRELVDWSDDGSGPIADGAVSCTVFVQSEFPKISEEYVVCYLDGDLFSDLEERMPGRHGIAKACLAHCGCEEYELFIRAAGGDAESASILNHRLHLSLGIRRRRLVTPSARTANGYQ